MKALLFVDDESKVLQGLQRQLRPMRNEWEMHFVEGGQQALELMVTKPIDVVVSDMMMPGMDGAQFLTEVSQRHPQTVRIVLSGHAARETILSLVGPAHLYLSKPCDSEELRRAITRAFALRDMLDNEKLKRLATRIQKLPTLPALQRQLNEELQKEDPSPQAIGEIISHDVGITTKILQLVNSAFFGVSQPINSPTEAVLYLGLSTVRSLTLSLQIFSEFEAGLEPAFSLEEFGRHSWRTAIMARRIAEAEAADNKLLDQCFLAGLLHDVGRLVLASELREEYLATLASARQQNLPGWQVEQAHFGATHANVGAYLLGLWGLPGAIIEAVRLHHQPSYSHIQKFSAVAAVHVANVFVHLPQETGGTPSPSFLDMEYLAWLGLTHRLARWQEVCTQKIIT
jgi:HD-like signal output (HDOD) protein